MAEKKSAVEKLVKSRGNIDDHKTAHSIKKHRVMLEYARSSDKTKAYMKHKPYACDLHTERSEDVSRKRNGSHKEEKDD